MYVYICHELLSRLFSSQFQQYSLILFGEKQTNKQNILLNILFFFYKKLSFELVFLIRNTTTNNNRLQ